MRSTRVSPWHMMLGAPVTSGALVACTQAAGNPPPSPTPPPVSGSFPILFVIQVPVATDFAAVVSTFGNPAN